MSETRELPPTTASLLPGAAVVRSIRRLAIWGLVAAFLYGSLTSGSRAGCLGGLDGRGGFIGSDGQPTDTEPMCYSLQLGPSPIVYGALIVTALWALTRVLGRAATEDDAHRILGRATMVLVGIVLGSMAIGYTWFFLLPVEQYAEGGALFFPFPFAAVEATLEPLSAR